MEVGGRELMLATVHHVETEPPVFPAGADCSARRLGCQIDNLYFASTAPRTAIRFKVKNCIITSIRSGSSVSGDCFVLSYSLLITLLKVSALLRAQHTDKGLKHSTRRRSTNAK